MPIYEYQCTRCEEVFELFQKVNESSQTSCPKCSGPAKKLISATNFVLKGPGFYVNDYPSKSRKEGEKNEKQEAEKGKASKSEDKKAA